MFAPKNKTGDQKPWLKNITHYLRKIIVWFRRLTHPSQEDVNTDTDAAGQCGVVYIRSRSMLAGADVRESVFDRQAKVPGFNQDQVSQAGVFSIGAGGLLGQQGRGLVRKGYGRFGCADDDVFTPTNYPRQLCYRKDLYKNKAIAIIQNLAQECLSDTEFWAYPIRYPEVSKHLDWDKFNVFLCNVDNNITRVRLSLECLAKGKPVIFSAVSSDAGSGYVFVQESKPGTPCFGCAFPHRVDDRTQPCPGTPACIDILAVVGGSVLYAVDSVITNRPRFWNLRVVRLDGSLEDTAIRVAKNPNCPLCKSL